LALALQDEEGRREGGVEGLKVRVQSLIKANDVGGLEACLEEARRMPPVQFRSVVRGWTGGREGGTEAEASADVGARRGVETEGDVKETKEGGREGGMEVSVVQLLLDGPYTDHKVTLLMLATYLAREEVVDVLLKEGAEVQARASGGSTFVPALLPSLPPSVSFEGPPRRPTSVGHPLTLPLSLSLSPFPPSSLPP